MTTEVFKVVFDGMWVPKTANESGYREYSSCMRFSRGFNLLYRIGKRTLPNPRTHGLFAFDNVGDAIRFRRFLHAKTSLFISEVPGTIKMPFIASPDMGGIHFLNFWECRSKGKTYTACVKPLPGTVLCSSIRLIEEIKL